MLENDLLSRSFACKTKLSLLLVVYHTLHAGLSHCLVLLEENLSYCQTPLHFSLPSTFQSILESIIRDTVMEHLLENNLLNQSQHGFMPRKSCCTNLLEFFEAATRSVDAGNPFDVIFLDFAKAFDKVPR